MAAPGVTEITFVYQGKTASYAYTTPGAAGADTSAAAVATSALQATSIAPVLSSSETATVVPVSIASTTIPVAVSATPVPATSAPTTLATSIAAAATGMADGPVAGNSPNGYASAISAAAAAGASASAAGVYATAVPQQSASSSGGGLSQTAVIGLGAGVGAGGLIFLIGLIVVCVFCRKRKTKKRESKYYVYTAEEHEKRTQMSNRSSPIPGDGPGSYSRHDMHEPMLPKVSEEPYGMDGRAAPAPHTAAALMRQSEQRMSSQNGSASPNRTTSPVYNANRPGRNSPMSAYGPRADSIGRSPIRNEIEPNTIPISNAMEAGDMSHRFNVAPPARASRGPSPLPQGGNGYYQPNQDRAPQLGAPASGYMSGFDFGLDNNNSRGPSRGPSPDNRGYRGSATSDNRAYRGPSPDVRPESDRSRPQRRQPGT